MKIVEKLAARANCNENEPAVTIAFLGDSVTQGCFELVPRNDTGFENVHDRESVYHTQLLKMLAVLYPTVPVNIINAGVAGKDAPHGLERLSRDVLVHNPDLTVVCFGLNDCGKEEKGVFEYLSALEKIFEALKTAGSEIIFMTPNMMATKVSPTIDREFMQLAEIISKRQNAGILDMYIDAAKKLCEKHNIQICDVYAKWKKLAKCGVDTTELLSNKINHPTREMHKLFASSLIETMMG